MKNFLIFFGLLISAQQPIRAMECDEPVNNDNLMETGSSTMKSLEEYKKVTYQYQELYKRHDQIIDENGAKDLTMQCLCFIAQVSENALREVNEEPTKGNETQQSYPIDIKGSLNWVISTVTQSLPQLLSIKDNICHGFFNEQFKKELDSYFIKCILEIIGLQEGTYSSMQALSEAVKAMNNKILDGGWKLLFQPCKGG